MRAIGLDIHRGFCEVAIAEDGRVRPARRIGTTPVELEAFAANLDPGDVVTLEATGNAMAIARIIEPHARVVLANPIGGNEAERRLERERAEQAEAAYRRLVAERSTGGGGAGDAIGARISRR